MPFEMSRALFERAQKSIPGGVNSPVRAFRAVGGTPVFIAKGEGAYLHSEDGSRYLDFVGSWGPMILGHAHPEVVRAVQDAAARGLSFGAPTGLEVRFAEMLTRLYPSMDKVRLVSSGTEATMSAIRVARGFTGRDEVVKFEGCYHGHADHLLVKAGSGLATFGAPDSAGVPAGIAATTLTLPFNDPAALRSLFEQRGSKIAAVIVEPVVGNMGCVAPDPGFLESILEVTRTHGALSIFDEVMTGSRLSLSGAQGRFVLRPDLTTLGKIVGGGMPLAAYGGRGDVMDCISPLGAVYQAGTLSGNPVAVTAGLTTLGILENDATFYDRLEQKGERLEEGVRAAIARSGKRATVQRVGSMITLFFCDGPVRNWGDADRADRKAFGAFFQSMLEQGIYWPPAQFEAAFVSGAHTDSHIDQAIAAVEVALRSV